MNDDFTIFPLGDCAVTIELGKEMEEEVNDKVLAMQDWFNKRRYPGILDTIIAYSSLTLIYDPTLIKRQNLFNETAYDWIYRKAMQSYQESHVENPGNGSMVRIGICYEDEFGTDLGEVSRSTQLSVDEIIERHLSATYRVYMLGFLPGFAYLGELDPLLYMPRKQSPMPVIAGSVGIVSNQTGIYPLNSPGGWHIIGRTPQKLFDSADEIPAKLRAGDHVQFYRINRGEFEKE